MLDNSVALVMACYDDPIGVTWTLKTCPKDIKERIVVDNNPVSKLGQDTKALCEKHGAKYIPLETPKGTSFPRDLAIRSAESDWVICTDSHCLIESVPDLTKLDQKNIYHAVQVSERGEVIGRAWSDKFRGGMQGIWSNEVGPDGDIFASGLGCFLVYRPNWLGFHPLVTEFGGEECYIHEKYRRNGGKAILLEDWRYWHCYYRMFRNYPSTAYARVRNYVLHFTELGWDLERLHNYFVKGLPETSDDVGDGSWRIDQAKWDRIVKGLPNPPTDCGCSGGGKKSLEPTLFDKLAEALKPYIAKTSVIFDTDGQHGLYANAIATRTASQTRVISVIGTVQKQHSRMLTVRDGLSIVKTTWDRIPPQKCDMLLLTPDSIQRLQEFSTTVTGYIVCFIDSVVNHLLPFLEQNPGWVVVYNTTPIVVLSNLESDRKALPSMFEKAWRYGQHVVNTLANSAKLSLEGQRQRKELCLVCPSRNVDNCGECGCPIDEKIVHEVSKCPLQKW